MPSASQVVKTVWKPVWIAEPDYESSEYQIIKRRRLAQLKALGEERMMESVDRLDELGGQMYQVACGYKLLKRHDEYLINTDVSQEDDESMTVTVKIYPILERKEECTASGAPEETQLWQHIPSNGEEEELSQQHLHTTEHTCNDGKQRNQQSGDFLEQRNQQSGDFSDNANGASV